MKRPVREGFLLCGRAGVPPPPWRLCAGPVELLFDPVTAFLRRLRVGRVELVRAIYGAVRDRNWGTVAPHISNLRARISNDSFRLTFDVECREGGIDFRWRGRITGAASGTVSFNFEGEAHATFLKNRIGLCVLHPLDECVGRACTVEHTDGRVTHGRFPRLIAPHQPFKDIRAITHKAAPGLSVEVRFAGETFEMEDQRNWTDASFKTYGTPLALPFPTEIAAGTRVRQRIAIRPAIPIARRPGSRLLPGQPELVRGPSVQARLNPVGPADRKPGAGGTEPVRLTANLAATRLLPPIGLGVASHGEPLTRREVERLRVLRLAHLRVDLKLGEPDWPARLRLAAKESADIDAALEVALFLTEDAGRELDALAGACLVTRANVARWLVFHARDKTTPHRCVELAQRTLRAFDAAVPIAAGTDANFAELNRQRPPSDPGVLPCFSLNPQVHAFDNETLVENLAAQAHAVTTAHAFSNQPVVVSPITLRPRFNVVATASNPRPSPDELPFSVDPRQMSLFGGAWTLGSLSVLAPLAEVHSLTFFETTGWRGVMERDAGSPMPVKFPSQPGARFPVWQVFAALSGVGKVFPLRSNQPRAVLGLGLIASDDRKRVLVANLHSDQRTVEIESVPGVGRLCVLDESNAVRVTRALRPDPLPSYPAPLEGGASNQAGARGPGPRRWVQFVLPRWALAIVDFGVSP